MDSYKFYITNFVDNVTFTTELTVFGRVLRYSTKFNITNILREYLENTVFLRSAVYRPTFPLTAETAIGELFNEHVEDFMDKIQKDYCNNLISDIEYDRIEQISCELNLKCCYT